MLRPEVVDEIPAQTVRVVKAAFPKGSTVIKLRDAFGAFYQMRTLRRSFPTSANLPWRRGGWR
jgi:transposase